MTVLALHRPLQRLTPGALWLRYRQAYGHGFKVAYYRDLVRPRILKTHPVSVPQDGPCEIHVLTSIHDWLNLVWGLKTLYQLGHCRYPLCIHEDGSLGKGEMTALAKQFPGARLVSRLEADAKQTKDLADYPRSRLFRANNPLALKILDFRAFLRSPRMFLLDSDVLFFSPPTALYQRLEDPEYKLNSLNKDWSYGYSIDLEHSAIQDLPFEVPSLVNSGLGLIHGVSIRFDWIEDFLSLPAILSHPHRIEQTLFALCSARHGFEFLPSEYDVHLGSFNSGHPARHFTGPIRHRLYSEGLRHLVKLNMLHDELRSLR